MIDILDPTIATMRERIAYVPRPRKLAGLRVGLIDNTRKNSDAVLQALAARLEARHGIKAEVVVRKHQRAPLNESQLIDLKGKIDFVVTGVGD